MRQGTSACLRAALAALAALAPERPGVVDVYGLVYAPYASENVFTREAAMVTKVLGDATKPGAGHRHLGPTHG